MPTHHPGLKAGLNVKMACGLLAFLPVLLLSLSIEAGGEYSFNYISSRALEFPAITGESADYSRKDHCSRLVRYLNRFEDEDIFLCELPAQPDSSDLTLLDWEELDWNKAEARDFMEKALVNQQKLFDFVQFREVKGEKRKKRFVTKDVGVISDAGFKRFFDVEKYDWDSARHNLNFINAEFEYAFRVGREAWSVRRVDVSELADFAHLVEPGGQLVLYGFFVHRATCKVRRFNDKRVMITPDMNVQDWHNRNVASFLPSTEGCPYLNFLGYEWRKKAGGKMVRDFMRGLNGVRYFDQGYDSSGEGNLYSAIGPDSESLAPRPAVKRNLDYTKGTNGWSVPFLMAGRLYNYDNYFLTNELGFSYFFTKIYNGLLDEGWKSEKLTNKQNPLVFHSNENTKQRKVHGSREGEGKQRKALQLFRVFFTIESPSEALGITHPDVPVDFIRARNEEICEINYLTTDSRLKGKWPSAEKKSESAAPKSRLAQSEEKAENSSWREWLEKNFTLSGFSTAFNR